jgi:hypothetical protein
MLGGLDRAEFPLTITRYTELQQFLLEYLLPFSKIGHQEQRLLGSLKSTTQLVTGF